MLNVSTIIPTYNRSRLLERAVKSALSAMCDGDEIIIVNDGSSDNTDEVAKTLICDKVRYFKIDNCGLASARNFGIRQAKNELIAFLDDDDEWIPEKLDLQRMVMESHPEVLFCFSNFYSQFSDGKILRSCIFNWGQEIKDWEKITGSTGILFSTLGRLPDTLSDFKVYIGDIYYHQMLNDYVLPTTMIVRRGRHFDPACFVDGMRFLESWAYSSRLAKQGVAAYLDLDTACQHGHTGERLTDAKQLIQIAARTWILEQQWGADSEFLRKHEAAYKHRIDKERESLIQELIANLKLEEARSEIGKLHNAPPKLLAVLAHAPMIAVKALLSVRKKVKDIAG